MTIEVRLPEVDDTVTLEVRYYHVIHDIKRMAMYQFNNTYPDIQLDPEDYWLYNDGKNKFYFERKDKHV